mmetsp:Transcript_10105/g.15320  ORF Transcript_10105/g.15320 Transcript_10105/m.15320 type:complete len:182 (-) Transcript_10105:127-672(-)
MSSSDVNNPMTVGTVSTEEEMKSSILETHRTSDIRESMSKRPSAAYLESMKKSGNRNADLEKKGIGTLDYEYRDPDDETESHIPIDFRNSTSITPMQKIRKIGKKTTCMAVCLLSFGLAMMITSFFYLRHINDNGFVLFMIIGICSCIPGTYATYNVVGKYFGWEGFEHGLPSYDRRLHLP